MYFILSLLLIGIGSLMVVSPQTWFNLTERWKSYSSSTPSDKYICNTRFGGIMFASAGILYLVVILLL